MLALPAQGRVYTHHDRVRLGDVAPTGRARLDALARWLQDAAYDDLLDSGLELGGVWVVRRTALRVLRFPRLLEPIEVATFCSGTAQLWAERSSIVSSGGERLAEAVAIWVHLQPDGVRPRPLPAGFDVLYAPSAAGRRVRARLRHPAAPPAEATVRPFRFRGADLDLAAHVNNAVYWAVLEDELVDHPPERAYAAEVEYRSAAGPGEALVSAHGPLRWIAAAGAPVVATLAIAPA